MDLAVKLFDEYDGLELPKYQTEGSVGMDLLAAIKEDEPITIQPLHRAKIPTGIAIELPMGCEAQVRPRSGRAFKDGLDVILGTIDQDFRSTIQVMAHNIDPVKAIVIERGERIAQLIIAPIEKAALHIKTELTHTSRGSGSFGSTGIK
jgi:dUTP pyrophosphatase